jgi:SAM-dependent methyltransferase
MEKYSVSATILRGGSLLRALEHSEIIKNCEGLSGKILDIGSGKSEYKKLFDPNSEVFTTDIDPGSGAAYIFDANKRFPIKNNTFDNVFCLNLIEHLTEPENCIKEIHRVLKTGGGCYASIPFLFPHHSSKVSKDCVRYTNTGAEYIFKKAGFRQVKVKQLGGRFSVLLEITAQSLPLPVGRMLRAIFHKPSIFLDERVLSSFEKEMGKRFYLGVFVIAKK